VTDLRTERLWLRDWHDDDREPWAALNDDPAVMEYFPARMTRAESDSFVDRKQAELDDRGWGLWAAEIRSTGEFIGFIGIQPVPDPIPCAPAVEVGWRVAQSFWGHGYAPEGARAAIDVGFTTLGLDEIVAQTVVKNAKSRRVMEKLGMTRDPADDFDHPLHPEWPERRHVLYRLRAR
jgi:RimJ/RimL family protein N-acetyltransferase